MNTWSDAYESQKTESKPVIERLFKQKQYQNITLTDFVKEYY
jgi:hypothetical protein